MINRFETQADQTAPRSERPVSMEITPDEYDHYMRTAQRMRSEAMAGIVERWFAGFVGLFARTRRAPANRTALGEAD